MDTILKYFLFFFSITAFSQTPEFIEGEIITRKGDTIRAQIKVLSDFKSLHRVKYINEDEKPKIIKADSIRSYRRGDEIFETLIINSGLFILAKRIIEGSNLNLYYGEKTTSSAGYPAQQIFIKDKYQNVFFYTMPKHNNSTLVSNKKKLLKFLSKYPTIVDKIKKKEFISVEEIVKACNELAQK